MRNNSVKRLLILMVALSLGGAGAYFGGTFINTGKDKPVEAENPAPQPVVQQPPEPAGNVWVAEVKNSVAAGKVVRSVNLVMTRKSFSELEPGTIMIKGEQKDANGLKNLINNYLAQKAIQKRSASDPDNKNSIITLGNLSAERKTMTLLVAANRIKKGSALTEGALRTIEVSGAPELAYPGTVLSNGSMEKGQLLDVIRNSYQNERLIAVTDIEVGSVVVDGFYKPESQVVTDVVVDGVQYVSQSFTNDELDGIIMRDGILVDIYIDRPISKLNPTLRSPVKIASNVKIVNKVDAGFGSLPQELGIGSSVTVDIEKSAATKLDEARSLGNKIVVTEAGRPLAISKGGASFCAGDKCIMLDPDAIAPEVIDGPGGSELPVDEFPPREQN